MSTYILAVGIIFGAFAVWVGVQHWARSFAARHPEFGPAREEGGGCGISCGCSLKQRIACNMQPDKSEKSEH